MYAGQYRAARDRFSDIFTRDEFAEFPNLTAKFFGDNAARFLGIGSGDPAQNPSRSRLESFYKDELKLDSGEFPPWWRKA
jgi:hypothetical protein